MDNIHQNDISVISNQITNEKTVMTSRARTSMLASPELLGIWPRRQKHDQDLHHNIQLSLSQRQFLFSSSNH